MSTINYTTLLMEASFGEENAMVEVTDLYYKKFDVEGTIHNEIVAAIFHGVDLGSFNRKANELVLHFGLGKKDMNNAFLIPFLDEYTMHKKQIEHSTRIVFNREIKDVIMLEDEKDDTEDLRKLKEDERKKQSRISKARNIIFLESSKNVPYAIKEEVYTMLNNSLTTPMVPKMTEPTILAGQLFVEKHIAESILDVLLNKGKTPVSTKLLNRTKYLLNVYKEWVNSLFGIMIENDLLQQLEVLIASGNKLPYEVVIDEKIIEPIISEKVRSKELYFTENEQYDSLDSFNDYMEYIAQMMTNRIQSIAKPGHVWNDISNEMNEKIDELVRKPYEAQRNGIAAGVKGLEKNNFVSLICEMGTGKTYMMSGIAKVHSESKGKTLKLLVLCPDHLVDTVWEEELLKTVKDITVHKIMSVSDLIEFEALGYLDDNVERAFILGQKYAKETHAYRPVVKWGNVTYEFNGQKYLNLYEKGFSCPCCAEPILRKTKVRDEETGELSVLQKPVPYDYFEKVTNHNYKCKKCDTVLWEPLTKNNFNLDLSEKKFVYSSDLKGFYPNDKFAIRKAIEAARKTMENYGSGSSQRKSIAKKIEYLRNLEDIVSGKKKEGTKRFGTRASVANYIFKKMKYRFTHLIADEFHEYAGESKRGEACSALVNSVKYVITGTGTAMNGYANSRFKADFMLQPKKMMKYGYRVNDADKFQTDYGVVDKVYALVEKGGKKKREARVPKKRPGISPLIFPYFMQDNSIFITMDDMVDDMPALEHYYEEVEMDEALKKAHDKLVSEIKAKASDDKRLFKNTVQLNYSFLDTPTKPKNLMNSDGEVLIKTPVISKYEDKKALRLMEIVDREINMLDNRMIIYTHYSSDNINGYVSDRLIEAGYKVTVLNPTNNYSISCDGSMVKVKSEDREKFIRSEVAKGTNILVTNPELVKTGLNLIAFPTILFYQMGYQHFTNEQAKRRAWRLGQEKTCKIIQLYYKETIQEMVAGRQTMCA